MTKDRVQRVYKGFTNIPTFRVWFEMVKRDLTTDSLSLYTTSDDPVDIARAIADYYIKMAEENDLSILTKSFIAEVNWEEITERALKYATIKKN
tara:strand:+ start:136 stop:417 length:282 start_codon:yes stop_codon:yes gene_type:complete